VVRLVISWGINVVAFVVATLAVSGIEIDDRLGVYLIAGAVFGVVNTLVKPIVKLFSLPLIFLTVGIALFFINLLMLYITSWVVDGFSISSFGAAIAATIIIWAVNMVLRAVLDLTDRGNTS
jgi:putative membrane protein